LVNHPHRYGEYGNVVRDKNKVFQTPRPPVSVDLAGGVEEDGDSSGRLIHGMVDLVKSTRVRGLVLEVLDQFKDLMAVTSALGR
jgi:hypothetical protein